MMFWNLTLAVIGMLMYCGQFDTACQVEPIAIFILIWSTLQFVLVGMAISACCYFTYGIVNYAANSKAAEDVMGAGFAFTA